MRNPQARSFRFAGWRCVLEALGRGFADKLVGSSLSLKLGGRAASARFLAAFFLLGAWSATPASLSAQTPATPQPQAVQAPAANMPAALPGVPQNPSVVITMDQAIEFARQNNPSLQAQRTLVSQNKEQEVTANLRPNPQLSWDAQYLPFFTPDLSSSNYIDTVAQFDVGIGYLFERGQKRQHR